MTDLRKWLGVSGVRMYKFIASHLEAFRILNNHLIGLLFSFLHLSCIYIDHLFHSSFIIHSKYTCIIWIIYGRMKYFIYTFILTVYIQFYCMSSRWADPLKNRLCQVCDRGEKFYNTLLVYYFEFMTISRIEHLQFLIDLNFDFMKTSVSVYFLHLERSIEWKRLYV